jgi:hypothetical protein
MVQVTRKSKIRRTIIIKGKRRTIIIKGKRKTAGRKATIDIKVLCRVFGF